MPAPSSPQELKVASPLWGRGSLLIVAAAAGLHLAALLSAEPLGSANDRSRWATVRMLLERGTFRIDETERLPDWSTIDKVRVGGHFYSSKPALLPVLAAGVTGCVQFATGWDFDRDLWRLTRVVLLLVNTLPWLAALLVLRGLLTRYAHSAWTRYFVLLTAAAGTLVGTFLPVFNNHTVAAASLLFALAALVEITAGGRREAWLFAACGLFGAFTATNELPAALCGLFLFAVAVRADWKRTLLCFVPAALVPIAAFVGLTVIQTGDWRPFYLDYGTDAYEYVVDGVPSYWMEPSGVDRNLDDPLTYALHCTVGHHGILSLTPVWLLALLGGPRLLFGSDKRHALAPVLWGGLLLTLAVVGFYLTRTENYNYGGVSAGLRWSIWLTPFWLVGLIPVCDALGKSRPFRGTAAVLLAASVFGAWEPAGDPWRQPWVFRVMEDRGWIDYSTPHPPLEGPLWTWFDRLPVPEPMRDVWADYRADTADGSPVTMRLRIDPGPKESLRRYRFGASAPTASEHGPDRVVLTPLMVPPDEALKRGAPGTYLLNLPILGSGDWTPRLHELLRGIPEIKPYNPGPVRYVFTPLRRDAFRCRMASVQVVSGRSPAGRPLRHRVDTYLSDEVPFGCVQFVKTVSDAATGELLARRTYVLTDTNAPIPPQSPLQAAYNARRAAD